MCRQSFFTSPDQPLLVKTTTTDAPVKSHDHLLLCFDVSKRSLTLYSQHEREGRTLRLEDELANTTGAIEHALRRCAGLAAELGLDDVTVLCESTGGYEQKLLQTARPASATRRRSSTPSTWPATRSSSRTTRARPTTRTRV